MTGIQGDSRLDTARANIPYLAGDQPFQTCRNAV